MGGIVTIEDINLFWAAFKVAPIGTLKVTGVLVVEMMTILPDVLHFLFDVFVDLYLRLLIEAHWHVQRCRHILLALCW